MMKTLQKALIFGTVILAAACTNPDRYSQGADGTNGSGGADGISTGALGDPNDPNSVAYFNQTLGDRVLFLVDQSTLNSEAQTILAGQAKWLMNHPQYSAIIEGHADEQGTRLYNIALGERRANAVREFLISQGVAGNRLRTISYGKERPLEICSQEACYAKNRRAVTVLSAGAGA